MIDYTPGHRFDYLCGWRYLLSTEFRDRLQDRWGQSRWTRMLMYTGLVVSVLITTAVVVLTLMAGWHLLNI